MSVERDKKSVLKSLLHEVTKTYVVKDGGGRNWKVSTAPSDAVQGSPCILTEYIYVSPVSTEIKGSKEVNSTWDPANDGWDSEFTV